MGKIIAVTNQKGGVGKTTTAVNLSAALAQLGKRVLLVDIDPQGNATSGIGLKGQNTGTYDVLLGEKDIKSAIHPTKVERLSVMAGDIRLAAAEVELVDRPQRESALKEALGTVSDQYDFILIDCPPSLGLLTINGLTAADSALVPIQCEYYALEGLSALIATIDRLRRSVNKQLALEGIVLTMYDGRTNLSLQVAAEVKKHFSKQVFRAIIPRNVRLGEAPSHGLPIGQYDPRSAGAEAYQRLAEELLQRQSKGKA